jgi:hypothetical protein
MPLLLILAVALALRCWHLTDPAWDYHNWRQSITLMVARDFSRHGFRLLYPQVQWVSHNRPSDPSYFSGEFSLQSIVAAALYKVFGESDAAARIVVIAFSLAGIWFLYDLLRRRAGERAALLGAFIYALLPYHLFFGRAFMPDIPAISLALGALDLLDRRRLVAATLLAAAAILQKLTVVFLFLPAAFIAFRAMPVFCLSALPALAWYLHAAAMSKASGFAIMQPFRLGRDLGLWLQPSFLADTGKALAIEAFSPAGLVLVVAGCLVRGRTAWIFRLWIAGAASILILTPTLLPANHYYLTVLLPAGAALAGMALAKLPPAGIAIVLTIFAADAIRCALPLYEPDRLPYQMGIEIKRLSAPTDLIVTETGGSPNVLYYADRRGWMLAGIYDPAVIDKLHAAGARYYADVFHADVDAHPDFFRDLDARFQRVSAPDASWRIYDLAHPVGRSPRTAADALVGLVAGDDRPDQGVWRGRGRPPYWSAPFRDQLQDDARQHHACGRQRPPVVAADPRQRYAD